MNTALNEMYFENLESIVKQYLSKATKKVLIAVAWISFPTYEQIFLDLLSRQVSVCIIVDDNKSNQAHVESLERLLNAGVNIKFLKVVGTMHHKFCLIDDKIYLMGSFNWSDNAEKNNIENLNASSDPNNIIKLKEQFESLWHLSNSDLKLLRNPKYKCHSCQSAFFTLLLLEEEGYNTKVNIAQVCSCSGSVVRTEYLDISLLNNYYSICDKYFELISEANEYGEDTNHLIAQRDNEINQYFTWFRKHRFGQTIIHAIAIKTFREPIKYDGTPIYKVIWKEWGTEPYIRDEYTIYDFDID